MRRILSVSVVLVLAFGCEKKEAAERPVSPPASPSAPAETTRHAVAPSESSKPTTVPAETHAAPTVPSPAAPNTSRTELKKSDNTVVIQTSMGDITVELAPDRTPMTVKNFLQYVDEGFYNNTIFHRVIDGFMIQGGGYPPDLNEKPTHSPIKNESASGLGNTRGTIAMARTDAPDSATSQFYINLVDNNQLDHYNGGYAAFGRVIDGMDVVDRIAQVPVEKRPPAFQALPVTPVVIRSIHRK